MDEFADNCIYIVENLNFYPEEFSCIEKKPVEEGEEEVKKAPVAEVSAEVSKPGSKMAGRAEKPKPG